MRGEVCFRKNTLSVVSRLNEIIILSQIADCVTPLFSSWSPHSCAGLVFTQGKCRPCKCISHSSIGRWVGITCIFMVSQRSQIRKTESLYLFQRTSLQSEAPRPCWVDSFDLILGHDPGSPNPSLRGSLRSALVDWSRRAEFSDVIFALLLQA